MANIFSKICKECDGQCCKTFEIFLLKKDLEKLDKFKDKINIKKEGSGLLMYHKDKCFFQNPKTGCILSEEDKPFDCKLFPLTFLYKNKKLNFYLMEDCSYLNEIPKEWIEKTKKWAVKELETWTEEDKLTFSNIMEENSLSELREI